MMEVETSHVVTPPFYFSLTICRATPRESGCFTSRAAGIPSAAKTKNKNMKTLLTTIGALALATALAIAKDKPPGDGPGRPPGGPGGPGGDGKRPNPEMIFKKLDANGDSAISLDEFKAGPMAQHNPEKAAEHFKKIDKDGNGSVSLDEFKSGRPPRPPGGPGGGDGPGREKGAPGNDRPRGEKGPKPQR